MFRSASPQLRDAARFALYAERMVPLYTEMKDIQNAPVNREAYALQARAKVEAGKAIPLIEAVLFPKDADGLA